MEIQGYENYLIYPEGRVYSKKNDKFLKHHIGTTGYYYVSLCKDGKAKKYKIHRLVAIHYIPNPDNKPQVDHINRNTLDNRVENLRWATRSENMQNTGKYNNNTSGHKNICYDKMRNKWIFRKRILNGKYKCKYFHNKTDALCYKFIYLLMLKA